jgi:predicted nucleic acid-binding protein
MGFAFESFDAIGQWRDSYAKNIPVDASGKMPNGTQYNGIVEFRDVLLERKTQIARAFASKLLSYATGRRMEPADRPAIDAIVEQLERRGNGFYDLVELIVLSPTFQSI